MDVAELDEDVWRGRQFMTLPGEHVPLATTNFVSIDQGWYVVSLLCISQNLIVPGQDALLRTSYGQQHGTSRTPLNLLENAIFLSQASSNLSQNVRMEKSLFLSSTLVKLDLLDACIVART